MSIWTYRKAILESDLQSTTKLVLLVLDNHVNDMGDPCFPSYSRIANLASLSRRAVITQIGKAESLGWIKVERRSKKRGRRHETNYFYLSIPDTNCKSNKGQMNGEQDSPMHSEHQDSEPDSPLMVNDVHSERTITELSNEQLLQAGSEDEQAVVVSDAELVFPSNISADEKRAIAELLHSSKLNIGVKQEILDEIAGAIKSKSIKRGVMPFANSLASAANKGAFKPSLGIAILAHRKVGISQKMVNAKNDSEFVLDPKAMERGKRYLKNIRPSHDRAK